MSEPAKITIVLTGGAGFIGSHLAHALLTAGHRVIVIDDLSTGREENLPEGAEFHELDIRSDEAATLVRESGASVICHQAAQMDVRASVRDPRFDAEVNLIGLLNLLEAGRKGGALTQVLFASSGGTVYGDQVQYPADEEDPTRPLCPYGVAKLASERYLYFYHREYGLDVTCLRYANVYGPRQNPHGEAGVVAIFSEKLLAGEQPTIFGDGEQTRDYVHVQDVVAANVAALGRPGWLTFNVGTGVETSVNALFEILRRHAGGPVAKSGPARAGEQSRSSISPARLQRDLGVTIATTLDQGLAETVGWFRDRR